MPKMTNRSRNNIKKFRGKTHTGMTKKTLEYKVWKTEAQKSINKCLA